MTKPTISVIVTNWNGYRLLKKNLETVIQRSPEASEFIVADDASTDLSLKYLSSLKSHHPNLRIIKHKHNLGFGQNSNSAVKQASGNYVVLLNNDIQPQPGYLKPAIKLLANPKTAAVGFSEIGNENWARIFWSGGYLQHAPGTPTPKPHPTAWVSGGGSIIKKDIFLKAGGFDSAYAPFYYEDADLGLRLWLAGYQLLWCPTARIIHRHEATMSRFPPHFLNYVKERNRLLLTWRIIDSPSLLSKNRLAIWMRVLGGPNYLKIIRSARLQMTAHPKPVFKRTLPSESLLAILGS
jgi:GT2 family glycosyltransferase